ncbi:MAG: DUF1501 domain-containing protein [Usitatibacter sp.]
MPSATRRSLLKALAAAPLAASLPALAAADRKPRLLVMVFLYGGNDGFNTWVPFTNPRYYQYRPTIAVPRDAVLKITDSHGLHPSLAPLVPMWQSKELALIQGIGYPEATQQHYRDIEIAFTAEDVDIRGEGWVSRALGRTAADAVALDVLDIRALDPMGPFRGERMGVVQVHYADELLAKRRLADCVTSTNARGRERLARDPGALRAATLRTSFPDEPFGRAMRCAVELAAADRTLPVIHVALNGLDDDKHHSVDTHWEQLKHHGGALKRLAEGLAALRAGMVEIGRWDETLVATYDEFGRSPKENADHGTHHGLGTTHFVLGGGVKGGLYGEPPPIQDLHPIGGPAPAIDTRRLWTTIVRDWWGADPSGVFTRRHAPLDLLRSS